MRLAAAGNASARASTTVSPAPGPRKQKNLKRLRIRPALKKDRRAVEGIIKRFRLAPGFDQKEFRVAEHRGKVVGCARLRFLGDVYELASLGVRESYHGRGVGTAMVRACLDAADERVFCLTERPRPFERLGFQRVDGKSIPAELAKKLARWCPSDAVALVHGGNPAAKTYRILRDKCARDLEATRRAIDKVRIAVPRRSHYRRAAEDFLSMAKAYYSDARHHQETGDIVLVLACVNYAHGWLDAGARLGLFDVGGDDKLFTLAE
jgi:hypothetical protein